MKRTLIALAALMALPHAAQADPLAALKWEKRPLLLFAKSRSDAGLDKQVELLRERRPDLADRDMVVLVTEGRQDTIPAIGYTPLPRGTALELRRRFTPEPSGFTAILVGKDGTEKGRWRKPVTPDQLFALIDSMPMRQREEEEAVTN